MDPNGADFEEDPEKALLLEAEDLERDIGMCVGHVSVSKKHAPSERRVFINLQTKEKQQYCIELSLQGYRVLGEEFDKTDLDDRPYNETIYSLLDSLSPLYRNSFGNTLAKKLAKLTCEDQATSSDAEGKSYDGAAAEAKK